MNNLATRGLVGSPSQLIMRGLFISSIGTVPLLSTGDPNICISSDGNAGIYTEQRENTAIITASNGNTGIKTEANENTEILITSNEEVSI